MVKTTNKVKLETRGRKPLPKEERKRTIAIGANVLVWDKVIKVARANGMTHQELCRRFLNAIAEDRVEIPAKSKYID